LGGIFFLRLRLDTRPIDMISLGGNEEKRSPVFLFDHGYQLIYWLVKK
jgi:hypothetical protein